MVAFALDQAIQDEVAPPRALVLGAPPGTRPAGGRAGCFGASRGRLGGETGGLHPARDDEIA